MLFPSVTCRGCWCGAHLSRSGGSGRTLDGERCLHQQLHFHGPQCAVRVCGNVAVCDQLVAVPEVPDVVDGSGSFEVAAGVVELDFEEYFLAPEENVVRLVDGGLLGDADGHRDLIW